MIFPNCPDVTSLFFQPQRSSTIKLDKSIDEKVQEHADWYDEYLPWVQRVPGLGWGRLRGRREDGGAQDLFPSVVRYPISYRLRSVLTKRRE